MSLDQASGATDAESTTIRRIVWRVMPLLTLAYLAAYIDRVNVGFAALTANKDLGLSPVQYGFGAGLFFLGYCAAQVPSNLLLLRVGARRWFARILISMGVIAACTSLVVGPLSFYGARLALGVAEAGLVPGVVYYMRIWFPKRWRARYIAVFLLAIPLSSFIGSPLSALILRMHGALGLKGWQWLYIAEGIPCVVFGLLILRYLSETPKAASWLSPVQLRWLEGELERERIEHVEQGPAPSAWSLLFDPRVISYGVAFFGVTAGSYGLALWLPQMVRGFGLSIGQTGIVTAIPFGIGCVATVLWARRSDRKGERVWHTALPAFLAAAGLAVCVAITSPVLTMIALSVAAIGIFGIRGPYFALVAEEFSEKTAAPGIAWVDVFAASAGFLGPFIVGVVKSLTGKFGLALLVLALFCFVGGVVVLIRAAFANRARALAPVRVREE